MEYVQFGLYEEALKRGTLSGELREYAKRVGSHEQDYVAFIRKALGNGRHESPWAPGGRQVAARGLPHPRAQAVARSAFYGPVAFGTSARSPTPTTGPAAASSASTAPTARS